MRMNKGLLCVFLLMFLLVVIGFVEGAEVSDLVYDAFDNQDTVKVIVRRNNDEYLNVNSFHSMRSISSLEKGFDKIAERDDKFVIEITRDELELLKLDPNFKRIDWNIPLKVFMQDVVEIVEANDSWNLQNSNINLTGFHQSVCILDTGINTSHSDFSGRILDEKCFCTETDYGNGGCCPNNNISDDSAEDDAGHGTHVAGIVGASGGISGVATDVGLVIVKMMDRTGHGNVNDLEDGIQWCIENAATYNISVVTASLGDPDSWYNTTNQNICENGNSVITNLINSAVANNISVTIASGNDDKNYGITWPSCITNATAIGATDKEDNIASYSNRGDLLKLLGIGGISTNQINSTSYLGGYTPMQGTSMATPVVAGAIALINQYLSLSGQIKTPADIEDVLYDTGLNITDNGNNFSRINVYDALLSLDVTNPEVVLTLPVDGLQTTEINQTFVCNVSDWQLKNMTFHLWNSTDLVNETSWNVSGSVNSSVLTVNDLPKIEYNWTCSAYDVNNNSFTANNFSFSIMSIFVEIDSPGNNTYTNVNDTNFTCNSSTGDSYDLDNVTFSLFNSSGLIYNLTYAINGTTNTTVFNYTFVNETNYSWNCFVVDNASQNYTSLNYTISYDVTYPTIENVSYITTNESVEFNWDSEESTNFSVNVSFNESVLLNTSDVFNVSNSANFSELNSSTVYNYTILYCDRTGNCNETDVVNFTTNTTLYCGDGTCNNGESCSSCSTDCGDCVVVSSGGGGGGGSSSLGVLSNPVMTEKLEEGYSKEYRVNQETYFKNSNNDIHKVKLKNVIYDAAEIEIQSDPVVIYLHENESKKMNLTSAEFYDLYIKVISLGSSNANIMIKEIKEVNPYYVDPLQKQEDSVVVPETEILKENEPTKISFINKIRNRIVEKLPGLNFKVLIVSIVNVIIGLVVVILVIISLHKKNKEIKAEVKKFNDKKK